MLIKEIIQRELCIEKLQTCFSFALIQVIVFVLCVNFVNSNIDFSKQVNADTVRFKTFQLIMKKKKK